MFEGIDCSGKTTIIKSLNDEPQIKTLSSPPFPYNLHKQLILENSCPMGRFFFFLASNIQISETVERLLPSYNVISDRYVFSTIAYHMALESISYNLIETIVSESLPFLRMPDQIILFTVDREEQLRRYKNKNDDLLQQELANNNDFQINLKRNYRFILERFDIKWIEINTTYLTPEETKKQILSLF